MPGPGFHETIEEEDLVEQVVDQPLPGLVLVYSVSRPTLQVLALRDGAVTLGRGPVAGALIEDERCSRQHARVSYDGRRWSVEDLDSRNGTFVDGERVREPVRAASPRVIRISRTLLLPLADVRPLLRGTVEVGEGGIIGPRLRPSWDAISRAARAGDTLLITGESGTGKELAARAYHAAGGGGPDGPFIGVNCATIPEGVAERLLFGARRGAYSGANADADGYLQAADGGTLFLDEVAELEPAVQAKLLRVLETKEVMALGASKARPVNVRVCAATCRDVHAQVAEGRFREDLYFRIGRPEVTLPPLRERAEEMAWLIAAEVARVDGTLSAAPAFVEACILRPWPGNARELLREARRAGHAALTDGRAQIEPRDLDARAGIDVGPRTTGVGLPATKPVGTATSAAAPEGKSGAGMPERPAIEEALRRENGNVTRAARALGLHRNQLRRWLARHHVDPTLFGTGSEDDTVG